MVQEAAAAEVIVQPPAVMMTDDISTNCLDQAERGDAVIADAPSNKKEDDNKGIKEEQAPHHFANAVPVEVMMESSNKRIIERRHRICWAISILGAVLITSAVFLGSFCGTGACGGGEKKTLNEAVAPNTSGTHAATTPPSPNQPAVQISTCTRTSGPFTRSTSNAAQPIDFQFTGLPDAVRDATVRIAYRGDFDGSGDPDPENIAVFGEGATEIGIAGPRDGANCKATPEEKDFIVARTLFNEWNQDSTIELSALLGKGVNSRGCLNIGGGNIGTDEYMVAEVSITLIFDAMGGCP